MKDEASHQASSIKQKEKPKKCRIARARPRTSAINRHTSRHTGARAPQPQPQRQCEQGEAALLGQEGLTATASALGSILSLIAPGSARLPCCASPGRNISSVQQPLPRSLVADSPARCSQKRRSRARLHSRAGLLHTYTSARPSLRVSAQRRRVPSRTRAQA